MSFKVSKIFLWVFSSRFNTFWTSSSKTRSLFLHPSITYYNYNYEHTIVKYCYNYDKFSILLICLYFTTNYKYLSLIASLCLLQYESLKDISYLLTILTNLYYQNYLAPRFAFIALYSYKKRLQQKEWTLSNKLVWHSSQAIYLCLCSYKYHWLISFIKIIINIMFLFYFIIFFRFRLIPRDYTP